MSKLSPSAQRLVDEARYGHGPSAAELDRVLDALHGRLEFRDQPRPRVAAAAAVAADVVLASGSKAASVATGKVALKLILATVFIGGSVTTAMLVRPDAPRATIEQRVAEPAPRVPVVVAPAPIPDLQPKPEPQPEVAPLVSPAPTRRTARATPRRPDEITLIGRALSQLRDHDAAGALAQLDRHAEHYPRGKFATERKGLRVLALCAAGRLSEGRRARAAFLSQAPHAPIAGNVRGACGDDG